MCSEPGGDSPVEFFDQVVSIVGEVGSASGRAFLNSPPEGIVTPGSVTFRDPSLLLEFASEVFVVAQACGMEGWCARGCECRLDCFMRDANKQPD